MSASATHEDVGCNLSFRQPLQIRAGGAVKGTRYVSIEASAALVG